MDPTYVAFEPVNPNQLRDQFIQQAKGLDLGTIIKNAKGKIQLHFYKPTQPSRQQIFVVIVSCKEDWLLVKLANAHSFPRGFPILWQPGASMQYFGFYPKFSNDERQTADDTTEFQHIKRLEFFKKWSGFLGQVFAFNFNGHKCWTVVTKNCADYTSSFVVEARRLFAPHVTSRLVDQMLKSNVHLCAEVISLNDQVHGARVLKETVIVTAIGSGRTFDLNRPSKVTYNDTFVDFFKNDSLVKFCRTFNLPCDSSIMVKTPEAAKEFMHQLCRERDFMTDSKLNQLITKFGTHIDVNQGTISHVDILGDCLEGLVIKKFTGPDTWSTIKYKFPGYTVRTMLLRPQFQNFNISHKLDSVTLSFVDHWCVTAEGKDFWHNFGQQCFLRYPSFMETRDKANDHIGFHIQLADMMLEEPTTAQIVTPETFNTFVNANVNSTIVVCLGPIGSGKSSVATEVVKVLGAAAVHIDGDELGIGANTVKVLGNERNDYTRWCVVKALMNGLIPVVSTGGGALFANGKNQSLRQFVQRTTGLTCKVAVCIAAETDDIVALNNDYDVRPVYANADTVRKAINRRLSAGEWTKPDNMKTAEEFADLIAKKSKDNAPIARKLVLDADMVFGFPMLDETNYGAQADWNYQGIIDGIVSTYDAEMLRGTYTQVRLLVTVGGKAGHITWKYDPTGSISYSKSDFDALKSMYPPVVPGKVVTVKSADGKCQYEFACPENAIHDDGSTHITLNSGVHQPKETKAVVLAMLTGDESISLPTKDGKTVVYGLGNRSEVDCNIHIVDAFGI